MLHLRPSSQGSGSSEYSRKMNERNLTSLSSIKVNWDDPGFEDSSFSVSWGFKINLHFEQDWPWLMIWLNANMRSSPLNLQVNIYWKSLLREAATESLQMNIHLSLWGGEEIKLGKVASSFQREEPRSKRDDRSLKKGEVLIAWWWKFERR